MDINTLTVGQLKEIKELLGGMEDSNKESKSYYEIGENIIIRTVTHIIVGLLVDVNEKEFVLKNAAWVADTGRFNECISKGTFSEVEMYGKEIVTVGRGALIDATKFVHDLPTETK